MSVIIILRDTVLYPLLSKYILFSVRAVLLLKVDSSGCFLTRKWQNNLFMFCNSKLEVAWQFLILNTENLWDSCSLADHDSGSPGSGCETAFLSVCFIFLFE